MTNDTNDKGVSYHHFVILRFSTNDETVGADLCVCPETPTSVFRADTQVRPYSVIIE